MDRLPDVIETQKLRLRRATLTDAEALYALFNNWNVVKWLARPKWPNEFSRTAAYLETANRDPLGEHYWVIERGGTLLGGISAGIEPASEHQSGEGPHIGYWLGEPHWGQGLVSEAAKHLVDAIFAVMPVPAIYSGLFEGNEGSLRVQQKLGFVVEARNALYSTPHGEMRPHLSTVLTRTAFVARPVG